MAIQRAGGLEVEYGLKGPRSEHPLVWPQQLFEAAKPYGIEIEESGGAQTRIHLPNGSQLYLDSQYPEIASATRGNMWLAVLTRFADQRTMASVVAGMNSGAGQGSYRLFANNDDWAGATMGVAWGQHINHIYSTAAYRNRGKDFQATYQDIAYSRMPLTGAGLLRINPLTGAQYEISQRARFGLGLQQSRAEAGAKFMRLTDPMADTTMSEASTALAACQGAAVLAMLEDGVDLSSLVFDDNDVQRRISQDLTLRERYRLAAGGTITVLEHQEKALDIYADYLRTADPFYDDGVTAQRLGVLWESTLIGLQSNSSPGSPMADQIDWLNKVTRLERTLDQTGAVRNDDELMSWAKGVELAYHDISETFAYIGPGKSSKIFTQDELSLAQVTPGPETRISGVMRVINYYNQSPHHELLFADWDKVGVRDHYNEVDHVFDFPHPIEDGADRARLLIDEAQRRVDPTLETQQRQLDYDPDRGWLSSTATPERAESLDQTELDFGFDM